MTDVGAPAPSAAWGRRVIHLATAVIPVAWAYAVVDARAVQVLFGTALVVALVIEAVRRASAKQRARFEALVGPLLKSYEANHLTGATWLAMAMFVAVIVLPERAARIALWAGAVGDPAAAIAGGAWQRRSGQTAAGKSVVGSAACAIVTGVGALWLSSAALTVAAAAGLAAAVAEWPQRFGDDNLRVTLVAGGAAWLLGVG